MAQSGFGRTWLHPAQSLALRKGSASILLCMQQGTALEAQSTFLLGTERREMAGWWWGGRRRQPCRIQVSKCSSGLKVTSQAHPANTEKPHFNTRDLRAPWEVNTQMPNIPDIPPHSCTELGVPLPLTNKVGQSRGETLGSPPLLQR